MYFLNPGFLWASLLALIPIIIHFVRFFKIRTLHFPDIQLLREIQEEKKSVKQLVRWLILLARVMAIIFLVLAFSMPFKKNEQATGFQNPTILQVLLPDNSLSMLNENSGGTLFEQAKKECEQWVTRFPPGTQFVVADASGNILNPSASGKKKTMEIIRELQPINHSLPLFERLKVVHDKLSADFPKMNFTIFSDFQTSSSFNSSISANFSSLKGIFCFPFKGNILSNVCFDSAFLDKPYIKPSETATMNLVVRNTGSEDVQNLLIKLLLNEKETAVLSSSLAAHAQATLHIPLTLPSRGYHSARIRLEDNGLFFDNTFYLSFRAGEPIHVSIVHGYERDTTYIPSIFRTDSLFNVYSVSEKNVQWDRASQATLLILNEPAQLTDGAQKIIRDMLESGKTVVFIPSQTADKNPNAWPEELKNVFQIHTPDTVALEVVSPDKKNILFQNALEKEKKDWKLPPVKFRYTSSGNVIPVWKFTDQSIFLGKAIHPFKGNLYFFTAPLNTSVNAFLKHAAAVPVFLNLAFSSANTPPLFYRPLPSLGIFPGNIPDIATQCKVSKKEKSNARYFVCDIRNETGGKRIYPFYFLQEDGLYEIRTDTTRTAEFALNALSEESDLERITESQFRNTFTGSTLNIFWNDSENSPLDSANTSYNTLFSDIPYWKHMLVCAIFCIFMEILLHLYYLKFS